MYMKHHTSILLVFICAIAIISWSLHATHIVYGADEVVDSLEERDTGTVLGTSTPPVETEIIQPATVVDPSATSTEAIVETGETSEPQEVLVDDVDTGVTGEATDGSVPEESVDDGSEEVADEASDEEMVEETDEEAYLDHPGLPTVMTVLPKPRIFTKSFVLDRAAEHTCKARTFRVDISGDDFSWVDVAFEGAEDALYRAEIGGLPRGIEVRFVSTGDYATEVSAGYQVIDLDIHSDPGSQKGNFDIPIIFTALREEGPSSVSCQFNLVNL